jgi:hypothetical protein
MEMTMGIPTSSMPAKVVYGILLKQQRNGVLRRIMGLCCHFGFFWLFVITNISENTCVDTNFVLNLINPENHGADQK